MSTGETEIAVRTPQALATLDPQALILEAIQHGASLDTMERLAALAKEVRAQQAREAWYWAMAEFQRQCPAVLKTSEARIQTRTGPGYRYRYAPLDEIMSVVGPVMGPLGLSISWRTRIDGDRAVAVCRVAHALGHEEESGEVAIPIVPATDGSGATPPQRVGIALSYAKRYAVLAITGIAPTDEGDDEERPGEEARPAHGEMAAPASDTVISPEQIRRLSAIASGMKWTEEQIHDLISGYQYVSRKDIKVSDYAAICDKLKLGPAAALGKKG
jgi:hypothetical protein